MSKCQSRILFISRVVAIALVASAPLVARPLQGQPPGSCPPVWLQSIVAPAGNTSSSLVLGPADGTPRVAYKDASQKLYFGGLDMQTGVWTGELADAGPVGALGIAADNAGSTFITFNRSTTFGTWGELALVSRVGGIWTLETIDPQPSYGYDVSIAVDVQGRIHVAARDEASGVLRYWRKESGVWTTEVIDRGSDPGRYSRLVVDRAGVPHVVYSTWAPLSEPRYAVRVSATQWNVTTIDANSDTYRGLGFDLDLQGVPHVVYHDGDVLYHASYDGISWSRQLIFTFGGKYASAYCDLWGRVHVAVHTASAGQVVWMRRNSDGSWNERSLVTTGYLTGNGDSIDTDVFGRPWIVVNGVPSGSIGLFTN